MAVDQNKLAEVLGSTIVGKVPVRHGQIENAAHAKPKAWKFQLNEEVQLVRSSERGNIVSRLESMRSQDQYLIQYKAADGRLTECWWDEDAIEAVEIDTDI